MTIIAKCGQTWTIRLLTIVQYCLMFSVWLDCKASKHVPHGIIQLFQHLRTNSGQESEHRVITVGISGHVHAPWRNFSSGCETRLPTGGHFSEGDAKSLLRLGIQEADPSHQLLKFGPATMPEIWTPWHVQNHSLPF